MRSEHAVVVVGDAPSSVGVAPLAGHHLLVVLVHLAPAARHAPEQLRPLLLGVTPTAQTASAAGASALVVHLAHEAAEEDQDGDGQQRPPRAVAPGAERRVTCVAYMAQSERAVLPMRQSQ
eukprot:CAMPEP_0118819050 /NCGR_PEP_ID=MMETSP1162-20130426/6634_1 /TAXON_ID=33656 /ORGANISM="Phaeocystis Sp, Strain CCMP2710" /LENGTH=120 /DNA_ID=CAMNT_0006749295 /DNA_START=222 /DNA_END=582 /DNA_ORIENTATION=+